MCPSSIKEISRLINKGMSNIYYWEKLIKLLLKTSSIFVFLRKEIWRNALVLKSEKVQGIFGETFILALSSTVVHKTVP